MCVSFNHFIYRQQLKYYTIWIELNNPIVWIVFYGCMKNCSYICEFFFRNVLVVYRLIRTEGLWLAKDSWRVAGYCHVRKLPHILLLVCISKLELTETRFNIVQVFYYFYSYIIQVEWEMWRKKLSNWMNRILNDYCLHNTDYITQQVKRKNVYL